ncbi:hypothetical protein JTB14_030668 [Gonioctena quinquepunctata]|nr:hypothetical protein JTB14_030668 [Gonioctena quinquepunctata]
MRSKNQKNILLLREKVLFLEQKCTQQKKSKNVTNNNNSVTKPEPSKADLAERPDKQRRSSSSSVPNQVEQIQRSDTTDRNITPLPQTENQHRDGWETQKKRGFLKKSSRPAPIQGKREGATSLKIAPSRRRTILFERKWNTKQCLRKVSYKTKVRQLLQDWSNT